MTAAIEAWNHATGPVRCAAAYDGFGARRCVIVCQNNKIDGFYYTGLC